MIVPKRQPHDLVLSIAAPLAILMTSFAFFDVYIPGDVQASRAIQSLTFPGWPAISEAVYYTGIMPWFYVLGGLLAVGLVAFKHRLLGAFVFVALVAHNFVFVIKVLVERPRPTADLVNVAKFSDGFSFPSGHVMSAVLLWGFLLYASHVIKLQTLRLGVQAFAAAMMLLMGLQRISSGAHWPTDVLAAYLWGAVALVGVIKLFEYVRAKRAGTAETPTAPQPLPQAA